MSSSLMYPSQSNKKDLFFKLATYILFITFFLNCFTPLRIHYDMLRYFAIKDCIELKCPPGADPNDYLPWGYTLLLLLLSKLGILKSFSIVLINCLYLFGGLFFVRKIFIYIRSPFFLFFLILINWTVIKFVVHPLSEMQYLFFSLGGIYAFYRFTIDKNIWYLVVAFIMASLAFLTRTIGITLLATFLTSLIWEFRQQIIVVIKKNRTLLFAFIACILIVLFFSKQLGLNHYAAVMLKQFNEGLHFSDVLVWHFSEWGEILMNTPKAKMISVLPQPLGYWLFFILGILGVCGFIYICFLKKNRIPFVVKAYLFFYILLLFNWPFPDPRFWVPIIPLIAAVLSDQAVTFSKNKVIKWGGLVCLTIYSVFGIIAVGYMTFTSFSKESCSKTQASGVYRNEYETHFFGKPISDTVTVVNQQIVDLLNKYDK